MRAVGETSPRRGAPSPSPARRCSRPGLSGTIVDRRRRDREAPRRRARARRSCAARSNQRLGARAGDRELGRAVRPAGRAARRSASEAASSAFPVLEPDRRRQRDPRLRRRGRELSGRRPRRDRSAPAARSAGRARAGERADDPARRRVLRRAADRPGRDDVDDQAAPHELRLDVPLVDRGRVCGQLVVESRVVGLHGRHDVRRRRSGSAGRLKPRTGPKPSPSRAAVSTAVAQSASTPSVVALIGNSSPPAGEHDRHVRDLVEALLQQRPGLARSSARRRRRRRSDAVGDPHRRAGEGEPDERASGRRGAPSVTMAQRATSARSAVRRRPGADRWSRRLRTSRSV